MVETTLAIEREIKDARGHSGCKCWWEEKGGSAFFEFRKETEEFCPMSVPGIGPARANDMLLFPSA